MDMNSDEFDMEYLRGFEDALEALKLRLSIKNIEIPVEISDEIYYLLAAVKENKIKVLREELGIFR